LPSRKKREGNGTEGGRVREDEGPMGQRDRQGGGGDRGRRTICKTLEGSRKVRKEHVYVAVWSELGKKKTGRLKEGRGAPKSMRALQRKGRGFTTKQQHFEGNRKSALRESQPTNIKREKWQLEEREEKRNVIGG